MHIAAIVHRDMSARMLIRVQVHVPWVNIVWEGKLRAHPVLLASTAHAEILTLLLIALVDRFPMRTRLLARHVRKAWNAQQLRAMAIRPPVIPGSTHWALRLRVRNVLLAWYPFLTYCWTCLFLFYSYSANVNYAAKIFVL